jgi:hypothetical protein
VKAQTLLVKAMAVFAAVVPAAGFCSGIDVCYSQPTKEGNPPMYVVSNQPLSVTAKLDCSQVGKKSLSELNQDGWSVVNVSYVGGHDPYNRTWMVVVEKK